MIQRDDGLRRHIGPFALAAAIVNGVVGAGIFTLPAVMAREAGTLAPFAYLACAAAMGMVVLCLAEAGSRMPTSGGVYGYVADAFGPLAGFVCGMMTWTASVLACGGIAAALAGTIGTVLPFASAGVGRAAVIVLVIGGIAGVNLRGVRGAARLVSVATAVKLLPLLFLVLLAAAYGHGQAAPGAALSHARFGQAVILAVFAFSGMETVLGASGEVADAHRTLPWALFGAMGFVLLLYVAIQLSAEHLLGGGLAHEAAPLAAAAGRLGEIPRLVLVAGAGLSMLGFIASDILGAPRVLFAFARDGRLPAFLGRTGPGTGAPGVAIVVHSLLAAGLALQGSFTSLVTASTLNTAGLYFLGCGAAWVLHRRGTHALGPPVDFRVLPVAACLGMAAMLILVATAPVSQIAGLAAVIVLSVVLFFATAWPKILAAR